MPEIVEKNEDINVLPTTRVIVVRANPENPHRQEFLVLMRSKDSFYEFPGGKTVDSDQEYLYYSKSGKKIELNEQALIRELKEETGMTTNQKSLVFLGHSNRPYKGTFHFKSGKKGYLVASTNWYVLKINSSQQIRLSKEHSGYEWWATEKLNAFTFSKLEALNINSDISRIKKKVRKRMKKSIFLSN